MQNFASLVIVFNHFAHFMKVSKWWVWSNRLIFGSYWILSLFVNFLELAQEKTHMWTKVTIKNIGVTIAK